MIQTLRNWKHRVQNYASVVKQRDYWRERALGLLNDRRQLENEIFEASLSSATKISEWSDGAWIALWSVYLRLIQTKLDNPKEYDLPPV